MQTELAQSVSDVVFVHELNYKYSGLDQVWLIANLKKLCYDYCACETLHQEPSV